MIEYHQFAYFIAAIWTFCMVTFFWFISRLDQRSDYLYSENQMDKFINEWKEFLTEFY